MKIAAFIILACLFVGISAVREGGRRKGNKQPRARGQLPEGAIQATWRRNVQGQTMDESGYAVETTKLGEIRSQDASLHSVQLTQTATLYDFSGTTPIAAAKPKAPKVPCLILPAPAVTFPQFISTLSRLNGSSAAALPQVFLDGTGDKLARSEKNTLLQGNPSLRTFCRGAIVRAQPTTGPLTESDSARVIKFLTLEAEINVRVPAARARGRQNKNKPGRRNNRNN